MNPVDSVIEWHASIWTSGYRPKTIIIISFLLRMLQAASPTFFAARWISTGILWSASAVVPLRMVVWRAAAADTASQMTGSEAPCAIESCKFLQFLTNAFPADSGSFR